MKIDYTNYLRDKPQETDPAKKAVMKAALVQVLKEKGLRGHISCVYYIDGRVKVSINAFRAPSISIWAASAEALKPRSSVARLRTFVEAIEAGDLNAALRHLRFVIGEPGE